jgi:glycosyltransferase involved in cell wall biosynthesis
MVHTKQITIHILSEIKESPWGGGNQFLKALKNKFIDMRCYEKDVSDAHVILFNSYPFRNERSFRELYLLKKAGKVVIHRIDGPIWYTRGEGDEIDKIIFAFNRLFAEGTIFQSLWSRQKCYERGLKHNTFEAVVLNAPDDLVFSPPALPRRNSLKIQLITTSWSSNPKKGFDIYQFLDQNLDFTKYEYTFIGNSPIRFKNIRYLPPLSSKGIAIQLRNHDLFVTASQDDPCSNSLLEALRCGLPAVARHSGGHSEILGQGGELFHGKDDVLVAIGKVASNLDRYRREIHLPFMNETAEQYYHFCQKIFLERGRPHRRFLYLNYLNLMQKVYRWKFWKLMSAF